MSVDWMPRCSDCRWGDGEAWDERAICDRVRDGCASRDDAGAAIRVYADMGHDGAFLETLADFGCVQFEAREGDE